jgi:hypothetical protein
MYHQIYLVIYCCKDVSLKWINWAVVDTANVEFVVNEYSIAWAGQGPTISIGLLLNYFLKVHAICNVVGCDIYHQPNRMWMSFRRCNDVSAEKWLRYPPNRPKKRYLVNFAYVSFIWIRFVSHHIPKGVVLVSVISRAAAISASWLKRFCLSVRLHASEWPGSSTRLRIDWPRAQPFVPIVFNLNRPSHLENTD